MKITKRQLRRTIREELVREGFFDWAAEKLGGLVGVDVSRAKSMEDAESQLITALGTYAMSIIGSQGGVKADGSNMAEMMTSAFEETKSVARVEADNLLQQALKQG